MTVSVISTARGGMTPAEVRAWLDRRGWTVYRLAKRLGRAPQTVGRWTDDAVGGSPPELALALCWLEYRDLADAGIGAAVCPACGGLAREDDGQDDRYDCVLCGARVAA